MNGPRQPEAAGRAVQAPITPLSADVSTLRAFRSAKDALDRDYAAEVDMAAVAASIGYSRAHFT